MTNTRIPAAPKDVGRLSLVLASAIAATKGEPNSMGFGSVKSAIVVLVDGLGLHNLEAFQGHAPFLSKLANSNPRSIRSECPSTTVLGLVSLASGLRAGEHGLIGYNVLKAGNDRVTNLLSGWEQTHENPEGWKSYETLSELHKITVVSPPVYERSGFTKLTMPNATFIGADSIEERFGIAARLAETRGTVSYVYIPELDQAGHRFGCSSDAWLTQLELLDSAMSKTIFPNGCGVVLTSDHGMVDVDENNHVFLDNLDALSESLFVTGGDTRCAYIYLDKDQDIPGVIDALHTELGVSAVVCTWADLVSSGWQVKPSQSHLLPDVVLIALSRIAFYDRRTAKPSSLRMVGHHGALSDQETRIPLITKGF